jgi:hypothetical protein
MNAMGQVVMSGKNNSEKLIISKESLTDGMYVLKMQNEDSERVVKVRR